MYRSQFVNGIRGWETLRLRTSTDATGNYYTDLQSYFSSAIVLSYVYEKVNEFFEFWRELSTAAII